VNFFFIPNSFPNARFYQKSCIRNGPRFGVQVIVPGYKAEISNSGIKVLNETTGDVWLEFVSIDSRRFKLNGIFFLPGFRIIATDRGLDVNSNLIVGNTFMNCAAAIGLGPSGIGLG
jgi:hypothetical protein